MTINDLCQKAHGNAVSKGFYEKPLSVGERLMLIVSELGEGMEAHRKGKFSPNADDFDKRLHWQHYVHEFPGLFEAEVKDTFEDELADTAIRLFDLCGHLGIDLQKHIELKMKYNAGRERLHGKKY